MKEITTKEEQDEIWEEFYQVARYCVSWSDYALDKEAFISYAENYIILRKPKEETKK